jgi:potassium voltage-gated channel KQT-like subfamily protein
MVIWFTLEFLVRIWSAGCRSRYQQLTGRLQFIRRPLCIVGESWLQVAGVWNPACTMLFVL